MDLRYVMYLHGKGNYYELPQLKRETTELQLPELPNHWVTQLGEHEHWCYCFNKENIKLRDQGWKIHMTTDFDEAQKTLNIICPVLIDNNVMFKFVANKWELFLKNSKYGDRSASGKFLTIYPQTDMQFISLLTILEKESMGLKKGPYILSDKRWRNSNIFFRYGGFQEMYTHRGVVRVLAIKNASGEFVEDIREPSYYVPEFVEEPEEIKRMEEEMESIQFDLAKFEEYQIEEALHFSNGGGVYKAFHMPTEKYVVLKEGRPGAGLDGQSKDAIERIKQEADVLEKLSDVSGVVRFYNTFQAWEHLFLVEEYIEGLPLNTWIAINYPFSHKQDIFEYSLSAMKLLNSIQETMLTIHQKGYGMGDLQPMNILVLPNASIKLIDFEAAAEKDISEPAGLDTPGFITPLSNNREEKDWFALLRIARHIFLPICPIQDLDEKIIEYQDMWIDKNFGSAARSIVEKIEKDCRTHFPHLFKNINKGNVTIFRSKESGKLIEMLRNGMIQDLRDGEQLLPGDIRQYETQGGLYNVLNGGFGVAMSIKRTGEVPLKVLDWVEKHKSEDQLHDCDRGLLTGKAGIAAVLYEFGYSEHAKKLYDSLVLLEDSEDVSLRSGMAGIGIALAAASAVYEDEKYIQSSIKIAENILNLFDNNHKITTKDPDAVTVGLFDGWSGVALYFLFLSEVLVDNQWKFRAISVLNRDLLECGYDACGIFQTKDDTRYFPYLAGGTAGIGAVMSAIKKNGYPSLWQKEYDSISELIGMRCCYNGGLFRGMAGFVAMYNAFYSFDHKNRSEIESLFENLNLYLSRKDRAVHFSGDYGYKFSGDIFSGAAGSILALRDFEKKDSWCSWLPIPSISKFNTFS